MLGIEFFYNVRHQDLFSEHANFETFSRAALTLFRCITGENWNGIMHEAARGLCTDDDDAHRSSCGSPYTAYIFFYSFTILGQLIMLNLFVAGILVMAY